VSTSQATDSSHCELSKGIGAGGVVDVGFRRRCRAFPLRLLLQVRRAAKAATAHTQAGVRPQASTSDEGTRER
jgi:hypothetical protein